VQNNGERMTDSGQTAPASLKRSQLFSAQMTHKSFLALRRFPAFDGLRALAALIVIVYHLGGPVFGFASGWLGVQLFFVLSGFLITTLLLREESLGGRISLGNFWIRRVFRILPAYYLVVLVSVIILVSEGEFTEAGGRQSIGWFLTLNPELAPTTLNFSPAWTIGIEQKFYLIWPLVVFVFFAHAIRRVVAWVLTVALLLVLTFAVSSYFVHFVVILFGCGLALVLNSNRGFNVLRFLTSRIAGLVALAALVVVQLSAVAMDNAFHSEVQVILLYGLCAAAALPSLCAPTGPSRVLAVRPLRWLGDRSYSIYLVQSVAASMTIGLVVPPHPGWRLLLVVVPLIIVLGDALHRWLELPCIRLGRQLVDRRALRKSEASAQALILGAQPEGGLPRGDLGPSI